MCLNCIYRYGDVFAFIDTEIFLLICLFFALFQEVNELYIDFIKYTIFQ